MQQKVMHFGDTFDPRKPATRDNKCQQSLSLLRIDGNRRFLKRVNQMISQPQSISQVLRLAGAYLDHKKCRLLKLAWQNQTLTLWRRDGFGVESKETFTPANLYDLWVHQYKQRKPIEGDPVLRRAGND